MSQPMPSALDEERQFWNQWGWLLSGVWVVFLAFPIMELVADPYPLPVRIIGLSLIAVFAAVYLRCYAKYSWVVGLGGTNERYARTGFLVLVFIAALAIPFIGINALGLIPFVTAFAAFPLTRTWMMATYAAALVVCFGWPLVLGQLVDALFLIGLNLVLMVVYALTVAAITWCWPSRNALPGMSTMASGTR